ncbi:MAG: hypothetical protein ACK4F7_08970 [Inhella sp.]
MLALALGGLALRERLRFEFAWQGVTGSDGRVMACWDDLQLGVSVAARDWFQAATRSGFVGEVHEGQAAGQFAAARRR